MKPFLKYLKLRFLKEIKDVNSWLVSIITTVFIVFVLGNTKQVLLILLAAYPFSFTLVEFIRFRIRNSND